MCQKHQRWSSVVFPYCANIDSPRDWWKQQVHKFMTYALLDDQSDTCFIKQTAVDKLGVSGPEVHLKLSTVLAQQTIWCIRKATYTREIIPARHSQTLIPETARKWPHLKKVADHLMAYNDQLAYYFASTMHAPLSQGKSLLEVSTTSMQNETLLSGEGSVWLGLMRLSWRKKELRLTVLWGLVKFK